MHKRRLPSPGSDQIAWLPSSSPATDANTVAHPVSKSSTQRKNKSLDFDIHPSTLNPKPIQQHTPHRNQASAPKKSSFALLIGPICPIRHIRPAPRCPPIVGRAGTPCAPIQSHQPFRMDALPRAP